MITWIINPNYHAAVYNTPKETVPLNYKLVTTPTEKQFGYGAHTKVEAAIVRLEEFIMRPGVEQKIPEIMDLIQKQGNEEPEDCMGFSLNLGK